MGKKFQRFFAILMVLAMVLGTIPVFATALPDPLTLTKTVTPVTDTAIADDCLLFDVSLAVTGTMPEGAKETFDIMLVLDVSGSMGGSNLTELKTAAKSFIDSMKAYNDDCRIGIVKYSNSATTVSELKKLDETTGSDNNDVYLKNLIDGLTTYNMTNIASGITTGYAELTGTTNKEIMLVMSDGEANYPDYSTASALAIAAAATAKTAGVTIYSVGMSISGTSAENTMKSISSGTGYYFDSDSSTITDVFNQIAAELTLTLTVTDTVGPDFTVVGTPDADAGTAGFVGQLLTWTFTKSVYKPNMEVTFRVKATQKIVTDPTTGLKTTNAYSANTNVGAAKLSYTVGSVTTDILSNTPADVAVPGFSVTAGASATSVPTGTSVNLTATPSAFTGRCVGETIAYAWTQDGGTWTSSAQNPTGFVVTANTTLRVTATTSAGHVASALVKLTLSGKPLTNSDPGVVTSTVSVSSTVSIVASSTPTTVISVASSSEAPVVISEESVPLASPETGAAASTALYAVMTLLTSGVALTIFSKKNNSK